MDCNLQLMPSPIVPSQILSSCAKLLLRIRESDQIETQCLQNNFIELEQPHHLHIQLTRKA
ncbi:unnamed protein product [Strongylus vulgaris]|uniref:Uncharacterized protein n=1 Tax=Strongylus vulgaris TaxID=40348 RepID=A0A3P7KYD7_STRVU|nr:unnamed protein product [Strongylus vulgaris]